ncbi:hypothetical protein PoB_001553200 [Plakobranchus ocellatus]|uniref:Uncharacterized protein n=1 Tax=Plakobranchus ocellatus TaxID=259542 RepID=A0AAV3Z1F7_9GAST|nr:hypothetical protein PoB_001553200 [Plakobranchus ocellatus]
MANLAINVSVSVTALTTRKPALLIRAAVYLAVPLATLARIAGHWLLCSRRFLYARLNICHVKHSADNCCGLLLAM